MSGNPYISQHYGESIDFYYSGRAMSKDDVDASIGFRRFPNAQHMTHTVFKPSKQPEFALNASLTDPTPPHLRQAKTSTGVAIDLFPSHPPTPRGSNGSVHAALPPLLPAADRATSSSAADSTSNARAVHLREWVRPPATTSSSDSENSTGERLNGNTAAAGSLQLVVAAAPVDQRRNSCSNEAAARYGVGEKLVRTLKPSATSQCTITGPSAPQPPQATGSVEEIGGDLSSILARSRQALQQADDVLPPPPKSSFSSPLLKENHGELYLGAPPSFFPLRSAATAAPMEGEKKTTGRPQNIFGNSALVPEKKQQEDSTQFLSPLSPYAAGSPTFSVPPSPIASMCVPTERRYMVLYPNSDPEAMARRRQCRRQYDPTFPNAVANFSTPRRILCAEKPLPPSETSSASVPLRRGHATHCKPKAAAPVEREEKEGEGEGEEERDISATATTIGTALLQELSSFLRSGNSKGFQSLSQALSASGSLNTPRDDGGPRGVPRAAAVVKHKKKKGLVEVPPPTVLRGSKPTGTDNGKKRNDGAAGSAAPMRPSTPPLHWAHFPAEEANQSGISRHSSHLLSRSGASLPSYAQPTLSWLSKGSDAAADCFPLSRDASLQATPSKTSL